MRPTQARGKVAGTGQGTFAKSEEVLRPSPVSSQKCFARLQVNAMDRWPYEQVLGCLFRLPSLVSHLSSPISRLLNDLP